MLFSQKTLNQKANCDNFFKNNFYKSNNYLLNIICQFNLIKIIKTFLNNYFYLKDSYYQTPQ